MNGRKKFFCFANSEYPDRYNEADKWLREYEVDVFAIRYEIRTHGKIRIDECFNKEWWPVNGKIDEVV